MSQRRSRARRSWQDSRNVSRTCWWHHDLSPRSMTTRVTLIPGDGIGPSITDATVRIVEASGASLSWDRQSAGQAGVTQWKDPMPDATLESIGKTHLALKGPLETPVGEGYRSVN